MSGPLWMAASGRSDADHKWAVGTGNFEIALFAKRDDALLFRAAPGMLAALREAADALAALPTQVTKADRELIRNARTNARAAIARATEEQS